jgi:hypothetical protein
LGVEGEGAFLVEELKKEASETLEEASETQI